MSDNDYDAETEVAMTMLDILGGQMPTWISEGIDRAIYDYRDRHPQEENGLKISNTDEVRAAIEEEVAHEMGQKARRMARAFLRGLHGEPLGFEMPKFIKKEEA